MLVAAFAANQVKRIFGVPGGGSSLDIIDAATTAGIEFVLTRTESAAVMMAAVTAELSGTLGVALTTKGPGTASAANGVAYASLDRAPVMLLSDGFDPDEQDYVSHQVFDQQDLLKPVTKGFSRLDGNDADQEISDLIDRAMTPPLGPVYIELTGAVARSLSTTTRQPEQRQPECIEDKAALTHAEELMANALRPVIIVGLEARDVKSTAAIRSLVTALRCPVLVTYKAKGVVADHSEHYAGIFTGGAAEADCLNRADLILLCGVDPVEFIRKPWSYAAPVIDIALERHPVHYVIPAVGLYGSLDEHTARLTKEHTETAWSNTEIATLRQGMEQRLQYPSVAGLGPQQVIEMAVEAAQISRGTPRITVDAGAHMFSAMAFWPCTAPYDALISNGLATMAFALPAAIAATMHEPERPVIAFTGDGGLLMCLGELSTAVEQRAHIVVIVFNDQSLSLIDIKQQQKGFAPHGVHWSRTDFARVMEGLGGRGYRVESSDDYEVALRNALTENGPALIDVSIDPGGYAKQLQALRG
jgi:acetolactate synthase-1/2/3 large subunit